jgi:hypothetical protein
VGVAEKLSDFKFPVSFDKQQTRSQQKFRRNIFDSVTKPFNANSIFSIFTAPTNHCLITVQADTLVAERIV